MGKLVRHEVLYKTVRGIQVNLFPLFRGLQGANPGVELLGRQLVLEPVDTLLPNNSWQNNPLAPQGTVSEFNKISFLVPDAFFGGRTGIIPLKIQVIHKKMRCR